MTDITEEEYNRRTAEYYSGEEGEARKKEWEEIKSRDRAGAVWHIITVLVLFWVGWQIGLFLRG